MTPEIHELQKNRGWTPEFLYNLDKLAIGKLSHIDEMVQYLHDIYVRGERIVIYPDYDCDGIMSGVTLYAGLAELGFDVDLYVPIATAGYGMRAEQLEDIIAQDPNVSTIITCDQGITAFEACDYARTCGLDVLITDHHEPLEKLPNANFIIDPCLSDSDYELTSICGAHVAWKLLDEYVRTYDVSKTDCIYALRAFAGIGTISDVMSMRSDNRILTRDAINIIQDLFDTGNIIVKSREAKDAFIGLLYLTQACDMKNLIHCDIIDETVFGFAFAPALNSPRRLGRDMHEAFDVFTGNPELAENLLKLNDERKEIVKQQTETLKQLAQYIYIADTNGGLTGLLASRVMSQTGQPTIILYDHNGIYSGSGRAPDWCPLRSTLYEAGFQAHGHEGAFGISFDSLNEIQDASEIINSIPHKEIEHAPYDVTITQDSDIDALIDYIDSLSPYGHGFSRPKVHFHAPYSDMIELKRRGANDNHLFIEYPNIQLIEWNAPLINFGASIDWVGDLQHDTYMRGKKLQLIGYQM